MSQPLEVRLIPVASIHPSAYQYRTRFDDPKQQELIESMKASGQSTPILVRPGAKTEGQAETENGYELVSGERRWRASKVLGWETIRAIIEEMTDAEAAARVVTENEVRADTNVMEKAAAYKRLTQPPCNFTLEEIAKRYGYSSHASIKRIIDLLDQPEPIRDLVSRDTIGEIDVRYLSRIKDLNARVKLAKRAAEEGWSSRMLEKQVAKVLAKAGKGPGKSRPEDGPTYEYDYNGFHCKLVGDEVILSGRNYNRTKQSVKQFVADCQQALESFLQGVDAKSAEQPAADAKGDGAASPATEVPPPPAVATAEVAGDLIKQAAEAAQPFKDAFSELANKAGSSQVVSDLLSFLTKPRSSG